MQLESNSLEVIKNVDYLLRKFTARRILITSDYYQEGHLELTTELVEGLKKIYSRSIFILDLNSQRLKDEFYSNPKSIQNRIKELAHYEHLFIVHDVKRNVMSTSLPEIPIDAALIVRTNRSIGLSKSRFVTNLIKDSEIKILGIIAFIGKKA